MLAALREAGASLEVIEAVRPAGESQAQAFEIWPENWATFEAFLALGRCWTWVAPAMGDPVRVGIASAEIESTLRLLRVKRRARREMFMELRAMEQAAIEVFENKG